MDNPLCELVDLDLSPKPTTDTELDRAQRSIRWASALVRSYVPNVDQMATVPDAVGLVVAKAAGRDYMARKDGLKAAGPFVYDSVDPNVVFTPAEKRVLLRACGSVGGSMTVSIVGTV